MLKHRLLSATVIIALVIGALFLPPLLKLPILLFVCVIGMWEYYAMLGRAGIAHDKITGLVCGCILISATWIARQYGHHEGDSGVEASTLALILIVIFSRQFIKKNAGKLMTGMAATLFGVMYVAFLLNFIGKLMMSWDVHEGRMLFIYLLAVVKCADSGAYFIGCAIGRHKLIPRISPAKSWEGCIGGILAAVAASLVFMRLTGGELGPVSLRWADGILLAVFLAVGGILGDLSESLMKRAAEIKDSGHWIQGMGGFLDVLDSLLFAATILYVYVKYVA